MNMAFKPVKFGKYLLLEKVATGGMAELYLAQTSGAGGFVKWLAIKKILPQYNTHHEFVSMFIDEAKLTVQLNHANIVQIYDFGEIEGSYFLAMEFVEGKNLREITAAAKNQSQDIRIGQAAYIASEITRGLDYAHRKVDKTTHQPLGIIHRDVSPQNILVSYEGEIKIIDFGIAKAKSVIEETKAGVLKGKFGYMSPEQAEGREIDPRSDLFSAGIILYELLTGIRLFKRENDTETLELIRKCQVTPPSRIRPDIPDMIDHIVLKALGRDPGQRYQSAMEFHHEISRFLYLYEPEFTTTSLAEFVRGLFAQEILSSRKRFQLLSQQAQSRDTAHSPHFWKTGGRREMHPGSTADTVTSFPATETKLPLPPPPLPDTAASEVERTEPGIRIQKVPFWKRGFFKMAFYLGGASIFLAILFWLFS